MRFLFAFLLVFTAFHISAEEMVCVQDLNNNGYAGESGETATCKSNLAKDQFFCPIGQQECNKVTNVIPQVAVVTCPSGYTLNANKTLCTKTNYLEQTPTKSCPTGYSYNAAKNLCEKGSVITTQPTYSCPTGQSLVDGRCYSQSSTGCNPGTKECKHPTEMIYGITDYGYGEYTWTWIGHLYHITTEWKTSFTHDGWRYVLGSGQLDEWNQTTYQLCRCPVSGPVDMGAAIPNCPANFSFNSTTKLCQSSTVQTQQPIIGCAPGYNYNPSQNICTKTEVVTIAVTYECSEGFSYNLSTKQCEKITYSQSCPVGGANACVLSTNGKHYCSSNPCMSLKDSQELGEIDGGMLVDNGEKDDEGMCLDQVLIFSGKASYCQLSGKSTAFQNCCKNDGEVTNDSMGSSSEISMAVDTLQAMYKVTSAAYSAYSSTLASGGTQTAAANAASSAANTQIQALMNPATIAWAVVIYLVLDYLMQACDAMSMETSMNAESGFCHEIGTYCKTEWLGSCVQKAVGYCCFNSKMGRIIHEQGRPQLKGFSDWGPPKNPDCRGFTPEEFRSLDFSKIDMSEYYEDLVHKTQDQIQDTMMDLTNDYFESVK